jgi:hypothetical protein
MMMVDQAAIMAASSSGVNEDDTKVAPLSWEYSLRKYLLLLATLVATVTYTAGLSPPGGVWQATDLAAGHLAGDSIMRDTNHPRYAAFFYLNTTAFASSLVVIVLVLILSLLHETQSHRLKAPLGVLRGFMMVDLLSLIGAYAAGTYRDRDVPVYNMVLTAFIVVFHMVLPCRFPDCWKNDPEASQRESKEERKEREKDRKVLMLLATFAVSVTYLAGFNVSGGFWDHAEGGGRPGEPVLMGGRHEPRLNAFVYFNSTAFFSSLLVAVQLLDKNLHSKEKVQFTLLCISLIFALIGLVGAYSTGSTRGKDTTIYGTLVYGAPLVIILVKLQLRKDEAPPPRTDDDDNRCVGHNFLLFRSIVFFLYICN